MNVTVNMTGWEWPFCRPLACARRTAPLGSGLSRSGTSGIYDRTAQTTLTPGGIFLENQDVGGNVQRRMGEPVRRLRALLPGEAGGRGYRGDLFHPRFLQASGCGPMRLQGLSESLRQGSRLRPA